MDSRNRTLKRVVAGGALALGAGALITLPMHAGAQDDGDGGGWVDEALGGLVDDGTLTQAQADAVEEALQSTRPARAERGGFGHHRHGGRGGGIALEEAADAIGIERSALTEALRDGQTIAEVATAAGVDTATVIEAMVAAAQERIDEALADGRIDDAEAAERSAQATDRITDFVNEGRPERGDRPPTGDEQPDELSTETTDPTTTTTG